MSRRINARVDRHQAASDLYPFVSALKFRLELSRRNAYDQRSSVPVKFQTNHAVFPCSGFIHRKFRNHFEKFGQEKRVHRDRGGWRIMGNEVLKIREIAVGDFVGDFQRLPQSRTRHVDAEFQPPLGGWPEKAALGLSAVLDLRESILEPLARYQDAQVFRLREAGILRVFRS